MILDEIDNSDFTGDESEKEDEEEDDDEQVIRKLFRVSIVSLIMPINSTIRYSEITYVKRIRYILIVLNRS